MKELCLFAVVFACVIGISRGDESWHPNWDAPGAVHRPLQIVHGHFGDSGKIAERMRWYRDECGLGGIVCNVSGKNYLRDDGEWAKFVEAVRAARDAGLRVWIYDENGYPSLAAGGVVLDGHPELESQALVYDAKTNELSVRPAYEYTHACNKYDVARRYPNPLNQAATERFLEVTHAEYRRRLGDELFNSVEAFFTDEPSLNAVNIGQIPEDVRKTIQVADPVDETVPLLPMVAWSDALAKTVDARWQRSIFTGDRELDRVRREAFWKFVAAHNANNFYAPIQNWCRANGTIASGHTLHEENVLAHVPLDGNKLTMLRHFDIPGLDMLNSDPRACQWGAWKAAAFPASAAYFNATDSASPSPLIRRRVMTEVSDFSQKMGADKKCATLAEMQATAAWQAAWGVTEFTLYYDPSDRDIKDHKAYCDFVGRLNAMLRHRQTQPLVALYYPIRQLQREYIPTATPLDINAQSPLAQRLVASFDAIGTALVRNQVPFIVIDEEALGAVLSTTVPKSWTPPIVIVPDGGEPAEPFTERATCIAVTENAERDVAKILQEHFPQRHRIEPASPMVVLGNFSDGDATTTLIVNTDTAPYRGTLHLPNTPPTLRILNPQTGNVREVDSTSTIAFELGANESVIVWMASR